MAYDPEARETSNSALIIGIVALTLVVGGLLAYYATRPNENATGPTTLVTPPRTTIIEKQVPVAVPGAPAPPTVIEQPVVVQKPVVVPGTTRVIERNTTTNTTRVVPGAPGGSNSTGAPAPRVNTNVTINTNPATGTRAGNSATSGTTSSSTTTGSNEGTSGAQEDAAANTAENTATNSAGY